jgi:hypothetical protein
MNEEGAYSEIFERANTPEGRIWTFVFVFTSKEFSLHILNE